MKLFTSILLASSLGLTLPAAARQTGWSVRLEPMYVRPYGHDQHVLTIHERTLAPAVDRKTAVTLDTRNGRGYRGGVRYSRGRWAFGLDAFSFVTSHEAAPLSLAAGGGTDEVALEAADRTFVSTGAGEVLYYRLLEDNDIAVWTVDLYAIRELAQSEENRMGLVFGVRFADFDNDYRAVLGIEDTEGLRIDASSNYGRMTGPLVGWEGSARIGRFSIDGVLAQSVVVGETVYDGAGREFTGPFGETPAFVSEETFRTPERVAIPITELRLRAMISPISRLAIGAGISGSAWWDVGVPPGVLPVPAGDQLLHENTLVFLGLMALVEVRF